MAKTKSNITTKFNLNAKGVLEIKNGVMTIENQDTGEIFDIEDLFRDFAGRFVTITATYDEDYSS